jgi:hypothetical protein
MSTSRSRRASAARRSLAAKADRHDLYERAVQDPAGDAAFLQRVYRRLRGRPALGLREDFCGTAVISLAWIHGRRDRWAVGIDLDGDTLAWSREHRVAKAPLHEARRLRLFQANVLAGVGPKADVACALNFSYCTFQTRELLRAYFAATRRRLAADGLFFLDVLGGRDAMIRDETSTGLGEFTYRWEQASFDPLTHHIVCHIHFDFPDGSSIPRAFTYDWRLWTVPELKEILLEAGYTRVHVLWERTDEDGEGLGSFYEPRGEVANQDLWWTYLVAER